MAEVMGIFSKNFDKLKGIFSSKISKSGYIFDEDVFMDTLIRCDDKLKETKLSENQIIGYVWAAFRNNTLRELNYFRNNSTNVYPENMFEEINDDSVFQEVSKFIISEFGEQLYDMFILHANGATYSDLAQICDIPDLKYQFRKIREITRAKLEDIL